jgi:hypothetical protein
MKGPSLLKTTYLLLLLGGLLWLARTTQAEYIPKIGINNKKHCTGRIVMTRLKVNSPDKIHSVVFSRPITSLEPDMPYWGKVEVFHKEKGRLFIVEDPPGVVQAGYEAFAPFLNDQWSPDGRYLVVWKVINIDTDKAVVGFLDVCTGTWQGFEGNTKSATTDTFAGWREDKPHTMLLIGDPPKWQEDIEAFPINEPDPEDCR